MIESSSFRRTSLGVSCHCQRYRNSSRAQSRDHLPECDRYPYHHLCQTRAPQTSRWRSQCLGTYHMPRRRQDCLVHLAAVPAIRSEMALSAHSLLWPHLVFASQRALDSQLVAGVLWLGRFQGEAVSVETKKSPGAAAGCCQGRAALASRRRDSALAALQSQDQPSGVNGPACCVSPQFRSRFEDLPPVRRQQSPAVRLVQLL
mmetsp:Transcript_64448/g.153813  ORF Transcript_64448/g.153813 Transcript_64448/m.153813 type:complete len:203 (+) Transcript_64448:1846-2454(+)